MARRDDLIAFAQRHGLKVATIADLISYRRRHDHFVERRLESRFTSRYGGDFKMALYVNTLNYAEHVALWKGDIGGDEPALVRMHATNVLDDVLGRSEERRVGDECVCTGRSRWAAVH